MEDKYLAIYDKMKDGVEYTAKELGVAPASMTAMVNRGLATKLDTSPRRYVKAAGILLKVTRLWEKDGQPEYFTLYKENEPIGMLCRIKGGKILDAFDKVYSLTGVNAYSCRRNPIERF